MSPRDRIEDVTRLRERVAGQLASGVAVPEAALGLEASMRFVEAADEDGLVGSLEDQEDEFVADVVEALRSVGLSSAADQVGAAWNWIEDGFPVEGEDQDAEIDPEDEEARSARAAKVSDVLEALDSRWEDTIDAERLEEALASHIDQDPEAYGL